MTVISSKDNLYTLINVFTVEPEHQQQLIDTLVETTEQWVKHLPGFVSASFHKSVDGTRVVNYAQWKDKAAFELMLQSAEVRTRMGLAQQIGQADGHFYTVVAVSTPQEKEGV